MTVALRGKTYLWMVLAALLLRSVLLVHPQWIKPVVGAGNSYRNEVTFIAEALAQGHGYGSPFGGDTGPTAWVSPLYPLYVAAVFKIFGLYATPALYLILLLNCGFSALTCVPIYKLGERIGGRRVALWSGWIWAGVPYFWKWPLTWVWEMSVSAFLLSWLVWMMLRLGDDAGTGPADGAPPAAQALRRWGAAGALWGVAALTNTALIASMPMLFIWSIFRSRKTGRRWLLPGGVFALAFLLVVAPWLARNTVVFHRALMLRSNFWFEVWLGNTPEKLGFNDLWKHPTLNTAEYAKYAAMGELAYVDAKKVEVTHWMATHPLGFLEGIALKVFNFWNGIPLMYTDTPSDWDPRRLGFPLLSILGIGGAWRAWRKQNDAAVAMACTLIFHPLVFYFVFPSSRYRHPLEPFLVIFAVYLVAEAQTRRGRNRFGINTSPINTHPRAIPAPRRTPTS